jgi:photosystem II stability/assembly factor-like uncharacterized protein
MRRLLGLIGLLTMCWAGAHAQWQMEDSTTTADLRGIDSIGGGIAWASGTNGTVIRTEDGGYEWQPCTVPPGAEHLDFRGIQAFDANTAIVMSSGKGDLSRLYKTTDGCQTWKLVFTNPDKDGFWDAIRFLGDKQGIVLGDPINGHFRLFQSIDAGDNWRKASHYGGLIGMLGRTVDWLTVPNGESAFAASNSALFSSQEFLGFVSGGPSGSRIVYAERHLSVTDVAGGASQEPISMAQGSTSTGAFSAFATEDRKLVIVGGDFQHPDDSSGTAALSGAAIFGCRPGPCTVQTPPHGYRSSVAYNAAAKTWITVGPNGTDISTDNGRNWRAVHPDAALHEAPDADRNWNALSLPFVVGPHGRIGKLDSQALAAH